MDPSPQIHLQTTRWLGPNQPPRKFWGNAARYFSTILPLSIVIYALHNTSHHQIWSKMHITMIQTINMFFEDLSWPNQAAISRPLWSEQQKCLTLRCQNFQYVSILDGLVPFFSCLLCLCPAWNANAEPHSWPILSRKREKSRKGQLYTKPVALP